MQALALQHQQVVYTQVVAGVGPTWLTPQSLAKLGVRGKIRAVKARQPSGVGTAFDLYLANKASSDLTGAPKDEDVFYKYTAITLSTSATTASMSDSVGELTPAPYAVDTPGDLAMGGPVTASGAGTVTIIVDVWAEVFVP